MRPISRILSWLYGFGVGFREFLYDQNLLPSTSVPVPTICIGNLAVGGTGKTPHTEYLVRLLQDKYKVAVLSRGYRRRTHGFVLADEHSTALTIGDEPMQMKQNFPNAIVAVCEDRVKGIHRLLRLFPDIQVVILDDAYQHRRLKCGYYILLTEAGRLYVNDHLMPEGRLRTPKHQSHRASAVIVTKCPATMRPIEQRMVINALKLPTFQDLYFSSIVYKAPQAVFPNEMNNIDNDLRNPLMLTGIAHTERFAEYAEKQFGAKEIISYADHHTFRPRDYRILLQRMKQSNYSCILTTQKDAVRMQTDPNLPDALKPLLYYLPIEIIIQENETFNHKIFQYVNENLRNR